MFDFIAETRHFDRRQLLLALSIALLLPIGACNKQGSATAPAGPRTFSSPEDAGKALAAAAKSQMRWKIRHLSTDSRRHTRR